MIIRGFWLEDEDLNGNDDSRYVWACPNCHELNDIGDDFVWNGNKSCLGKHSTKDSYCCYYCESEDEHIIYRD